MIDGLYVMDKEGNAVPCGVAEWRAQRTDGSFVVKKDDVNGHLVSTVFLGMDHNFSCEGPPVLWETMVFSPTGESVDVRRYTSREDALAGHAEVCLHLHAGRQSRF